MELKRDSRRTPKVEQSTAERENVRFIRPHFAKSLIGLKTRWYDSPPNHTNSIWFTLVSLHGVVRFVSFWSSFIPSYPLILRPDFDMK